jgi:anti-sigma regulatory factor (Ser/Thr protein kinase)
MPRRQNPEIRTFILQQVEQNPTTVALMAAKKFGVTRMSISRYMTQLVQEGLLIAEGKTRGRHYKLNTLVTFQKFLERDGRWNEDTVWREHIRPLMVNVRPNIIDLFQYGFTEMLNNVLDHSQSPDALIHFEQTHNKIRVEILDSGVGIFEKIKNDFRLEDVRTALLELTKGKITSDKRRHSGEGIYFTSRMFDKFTILSGELYFGRTKREEEGWLIESGDQQAKQNGTYVTLEISTDADWSPRDVFDKYQGDDIHFRKTHVPVVLGKYPGEQLVSRSQAKRILARVSNFSEVLLDFEGVEEIGQPFADEVFRVFRNEHPDTKVSTIGTNERVSKMIEYVQANRDEG